MVYLQAENITKSYGDLLLFSGISLSIHKEQKVALIAKNGTGKTSLLNIIAGRDTPDSGQIIFRNDITTGYLEQDPAFNMENTVIEEVFHSSSHVIKVIKAYEEAINSDDKLMLEHAMEQMDLLKAWDFETKVKQILGELKIGDFSLKMKELSGGQRKRVALANVLINEPDVLIMDEPTNHLDLEMIEWLEDYLMRSKSSLLMVTHDRYFMDRVCNDILELDEKTMFHYRGNYQYFLEKRDERILNFNTEVERAKNLFRRELDWMRRMPKARTTKAKSRIEAFYEIEEKASQKINNRTIRLNLRTERLGNKILEISYLNKRFDQTVILDNFTYIFNRYDKLGIIGNNGTGKSTFLNIITGGEEPDSGRFEVGETVVFGYYRQEGIKFNENHRVIDIVKEVAEVVTLGDGKKLSIHQFMNFFLFPPEMQNSFVYKLSGGEKRRLYLMTVLMKNPNFLILDEPTNDLDILTLNVLEEYLQSFTGCVLIVSHDRYFLDKVANFLLVFEGNGKIKEFPGNYTDYREHCRIKAAHKRTLPKVETPDKKKQVKDRVRKMSFNEQREYECLTLDIAALEDEKAQIESFLSSGSVDHSELIEKSNRLGDVLKLLDEKTDRWLELSELE